MGVQTLHAAHIQDHQQVAICANRNDDSRHVCEQERDAGDTDQHGQNNIDPKTPLAKGTRAV